MSKSTALVSDRLLARNGLWNVSRLALSMLVDEGFDFAVDRCERQRSFRSIRHRLDGGSYFSLFDLGAKRAVTKLGSDFRAGQMNQWSST